MITGTQGRGARAALPLRTELTILVSVAMLIASYVVLRYGGRWGEGDTHTFTRTIRSLVISGRLVPGSAADWVLYGNGYGYQSIVVFLMNVCGLNLAQVQTFGSALLMVWIVFPAWLAYREFTGSRAAATLGTIILLVQPEFLFPVLRGTHEKFTRGLMLLCFYLLMRALRSRREPARFAGLVVAFYVVAHALITMNNMLATSFTVAVAVALILSWLVTRLGRWSFPTDSDTLGRLASVAVTLVIIAYLFTFYSYPPARQGLRMMETIVDQFASLFLSVDTETANPYTVVGGLWVSPVVYFMLSAANWLLLGSSAVLWSWQSLAWLRRRWQPRGENQVLLWAFYGAFAVQGALSIGVDISGALASNLQHRVFPSFAMLAAPVVARALTTWHPAQPRVRWLVNTGLTAAIAVLVVLSTMKATAEPLVSHKWYFYAPGEMRAMDWAEETLAGRAVWSENDERIFSAIRVQTGGEPRKVLLDATNVGNSARDFMVSDVTRRRTARWGGILPVEWDSFITYDNGQAQMYHHRPRSVFQR